MFQLSLGFIGSCLHDLEYSTVWVTVSPLGRMDPPVIVIKIS